jgi:plastocyanin
MKTAAFLIFGGLLLASQALAAPAPRGAAPDAGPVIVAVPGSWLEGYATPAAVVLAGGALTFVNGDVMNHNVAAYQTFGTDDQPWCINFQPGRCPLFWSELVSFGESTPVLGLDKLQPLTTYNYYCTTHPGPMRGTLVVLPGV